MDYKKYLSSVGLEYILANFMYSLVKRGVNKMFYGKNVQDLTLADIDKLIVEGVGESKTIDYKRDLEFRTAEKKKEFLADVSSFANSSGGYLIYGVDADKIAGKPVKIAGTKLIKPDQETLEMQQIIRDNITPRIPNVEIQPIEFENDKYVVVIHIPKSWAAPHMIKSSVFYTRRSNGKDPLDMSEIRSAFLISDSLNQQVKEFRFDRINKILLGELPIAVPEGPKIVLHIAPIRAFTDSYSLSVQQMKGISLFHPLISGGSLNQRPNFHGLMTFTQHYSDHYSDLAGSYVQIFRTGCLEAVETQFFTKTYQDMPALSTTTYEGRINQCLGNYFHALKELEIQPPFYIMFTLLHVKNHIVVQEHLRLIPNQIRISEDHLITIPVFIDSFDFDFQNILRPAYEAVWNAGGYERDLNYDKDGNWLGMIINSTV